MRYTCGIIFYRDGQILIGHTTGQEHWDLPKGKAEDGESFKEAAVRECYEETGYEVSEDELLLIGEVSYRKGKRLVLFFYTSRDKPDSEQMECISTYTNRYGQEKPELDKFMYIDVEDCQLYLTERMCNSIIKAVTKFVEQS
ncbi:NTP pyrophosphohydrolases including oxidative damage repair enzymes [Yersinia phage fHe-Yen9-04]|uniref:NTP pyrophosphohydrolases including oxidative damage repair enzymes n=2 Tax=Eneladusvirus Yen904 TaxID=2560849 RepID=A0A2C9CXC6_9CAUD|nr:nudix hydrolase [Yersinia phage fHe-Yen9-04]SOK58461.1 NTP pyrophosphohydrolases including oxidative damage repair enzymes [Yersinia phage fHe-Yen9-04]SOK58996.1 NTP pyrophosphohydrolases including oxidative damage repair enzymes [Yersinia phage fHe-Yen9-03]VUE36230.1 NTP pyrophosphohydrolases including oxidative damage repair enzymes [Yersinia phage fHe-Yen9-04]